MSLMNNASSTITSNVEAELKNEIKLIHSKIEEEKIAVLATIRAEMYNAHVDLIEQFEKTFKVARYSLAQQLRDVQNDFANQLRDTQIDFAK